MRMSPARLLSFTLIPLLLTACGDDDAPAGDGGPSDGGLTVCEDMPVLGEGDPDGHAEPLGASAGEARAGRVEAGELPEDPAGLAVWEAGDFLLANDRVAVLIEDAGPSAGLDSFGGKLVGIFTVEEGALVAPADFNEVSTAVGRFGFEPTSVTVMNDGSDGSAAVVRAVGRLTELPFIEPVDAIELLFPNDYTDLRVAVDYTLEPDAEHLDITYTFASEDAAGRPVPNPVHFFVQYDRMMDWTPVQGFAVSASDNTPFIAFVEDDATSFAWESPGAELEPNLEISGVQVYLSTEPFTIAPCGTSEYHFARVHVGGPGLDGLLAAKARTEGTETREVTVTVTEPDGSPALGARVHALMGEQHLTRATVDGPGEAVLTVPADADVEVVAYVEGAELAGPVSVPASATTADLAFTEGGFIHVTATEAGPGPAAGLPVRVMVLPAGGPPEVPESFGERIEGRGRLQVEFPLDGDITLRVPAGDHTVVVSRGFEYELISETVSVAAGETVELPVTMDRVVDTTGLMCGDFHIHTHRSPDAQDSPRLKLASAAGDGLEIPVRSDHEWVAAFEPLVAEMGIEPWLYGVTSLELTTFAWGHFGVFPLEPMPSALNGGAFEWYGQSPPEVFADVRGRTTAFGQPTIIVNHPRNFPFGGAYLDVAGYDPDTGMVENPEMWDEEISLIEVFNDSDFDDNLGGTVVDWFSFLNSGRRMYAVGSSDSHEIMDGPVGYPRTCVRVGTDDPAELRTLGSGHLRDVMLDGDLNVTGGIYVDAVAAGGVTPGGTVTGAGATELVTVTVQAATWIEASTLRVFVDGELIETLPIDETTVSPTNPVVRFEQDVMVPVMDGAAGSWVVLVASAPEGADLAPLHPGRTPFGVTNPIFFTR